MVLQKEKKMEQNENFVKSSMRIPVLPGEGEALRTKQARMINKKK